MSFCLIELLIRGKKKTENKDAVLDAVFAVLEPVVYFSTELNHFHFCIKERIHTLVGNKTAYVLYRNKF